MSSWLPWLISGGVVLVLGVLGFVYFKFLRTKSQVNAMVSMAGKMVAAIAAVLPDDKEKLDAHDVVLVVGLLAEEMPKWVEDPSNAQFADLKDELLAFVEAQRTVIPQLASLPKETLEMVAKVLFDIAKALLPAEPAPAPAAPAAPAEPSA